MNYGGDDFQRLLILNSSITLGELYELWLEFIILPSYYYSIE
jgi:hypothetical protein